MGNVAIMALFSFPCDCVVDWRWSNCRTRYKRPPDTIVGTVSRNNDSYSGLKVSVLALVETLERRASESVLLKIEETVTTSPGRT